MVMECLECNYKCGTPFNLAFHYNIEHWDKIGEDGSLSGICISELASSSASKSCSNSTSSSVFFSNSNSNSNSYSSPEPSLKPNPKPNLTYAKIKFDITYKVCKKYKVIKQLTTLIKRNQSLTEAIQKRFIVKIVLLLLALVD